MEGTPPMSLFEDETGVKLIIIIIIAQTLGLLFGLNPCSLQRPDYCFVEQAVSH